MSAKVKVLLECGRCDEAIEISAELHPVLDKQASLLVVDKAHGWSRNSWAGDLCPACTEKDKSRHD